MIKKIKSICDVIAIVFAILSMTGMLDKTIALGVAFGFLGISNLLVAKGYFDADKRKYAYFSLAVGLLMYIMLAVCLFFA